MLLRCQPLKRTMFVFYVAKIRIPLLSCYLLFYYAQTLNTSMQFNTPLQFPTSCLKSMKSSACNLMTIFVKDVCCLKFCWNTSFLPSQIFCCVILISSMKDSRFKKSANCSQFVVDNSMGQIAFLSRGHPLSNYAKGRGEGGIKMRNNV